MNPAIHSRTKFGRGIFTCCGFRPSTLVLMIMPVLVALLATRATAQLNKAYDDGYKPMLDLASNLKDLVDSDTKRGDFSAVRDLGDKYMNYLEKLTSAMEKVGDKFSDGDSQSWARDARSTTLSSAKEARRKAEELRARGDNKQDCKAEAIDLQQRLTDLSDQFKSCWKAHEERRQKLMDAYNTTRDKWWDATKDDRRPVDDLAKKAGDLRNKRNELQVRADEASKLFMKVQDQCDQTRAALHDVKVDEKNPDELNDRFKAWVAADDLLKKVTDAAVRADRELADADKAYGDAEADLQKAVDKYIRDEADGNDLYKLVLERHKRAYELAQEYKPFSW